MAAVSSSSASLHPAAGADLLPPLHTTAPRPRCRAREVSSRYLSTPVPSSSPRLSTSSSRASSPTPSPRTHTRVATPFANENHPPVAAAPPTIFSRKRAVQKLFGETGANTNPRASVSASATDAATPRFLPRSSSGPTPSTARRGYPRSPTPARASSCHSAAADDAASCCSTDMSSTLTDFSETDGITVAAPCESPPLLGPAPCRGGRLSSELRASVPESGGSARTATPLCYRSLNSALSSCQAPAGRVVTAPRPPQPHGLRVAELKKAAIVGGRKVAGKQEDVHQLRLLDNRNVQYRFLKARAEAVARAKTAAAENSLFGLAERIARLRNSAAEKRAEAQKIKRDQRLFSTVVDQEPYLDQWSDVEENYSSCLTGATSALHNASLRLPVIGSVRANCEEISEVLNSSVQLLEPVSSCVEKLLPKVEEVDGIASNLAQVIASERALVEECGNLLYQAHHIQMREYSLRSQLLQLKSWSNINGRREESEHGTKSFVPPVKLIFLTSGEIFKNGKVT